MLRETKKRLKAWRRRATRKIRRRCTGIWKENLCKFYVKFGNYCVSKQSCFFQNPKIKEGMKK